MICSAIDRDWSVLALVQASRTYLACLESRAVTTLKVYEWNVVHD